MFGKFRFISCAPVLQIRIRNVYYVLYIYVICWNYLYSKSLLQV